MSVFWKILKKSFIDSYDYLSLTIVSSSLATGIALVFLTLLRLTPIGRIPPFFFHWRPDLIRLPALPCDCRCVRRIEEDCNSRRSGFPRHFFSFKTIPFSSMETRVASDLHHSDSSDSHLVLFHSWRSCFQDCWDRIFIPDAVLGVEFYLPFPCADRTETGRIYCHQTRISSSHG